MGSADDDLDAAQLAHEIANALTAIRGWTDIARERPEHVERALELIAASAAAAWPRARALSGHPRAKRDPAPLELLPVVQDAVSSLQPLAEERDVALTTVIPAEALYVAGPRDELWTVVVNLVKNAVEAARTRVRVDVELVADAVHVVVTDDGPGMTAKEFGAGVTTKPDGSGLGLVLVRRALEALGGHVVLKSSASRGLRVAAVLPRRDAPRGAAGRGAARAVSGTQPRALAHTAVLVVEDDAAVRELLQTVLTLRGATVTVAGSARDARGGTQIYDLAIIDLNLGDARGDALLGELRDAGRVGGAVLVSGSAPPVDVDPRAAPVTWLRKPFVLEDVVTTASGAVVAATGAVRKTRGR